MRFTNAQVAAKIRFCSHKVAAIESDGAQVIQHSPYIESLRSDSLIDLQCLLFILLRMGQFSSLPFHESKVVELGCHITAAGGDSLSHGQGALVKCFRLVKIVFQVSDVAEILHALSYDQAFWGKAFGDLQRATAVIFGSPRITRGGKGCSRV